MLPYLTASMLGALIGVAELITRYRDRPASLVRVLSTWVYVLINASAGGVALYLMHAFGWDFGSGRNAGARHVTQVLVASFGSMALFRSALFTIRVHDQDVAVGPSTLLSSLLAAADRGVDRMVARNRAQAAGRIMSDISFAKSHLALPALCLALLQNVAAEDQRDLRTAVDALAASPMTDAQKSLNLGLLLMNIAGPEVVGSAVDTLYEEIKKDRPELEDAATAA